jgi:hypothetical protein
MPKEWREHPACVVPTSLGLVGPIGPSCRQPAGPEGERTWQAGGMPHYGPVAASRYARPRKELREALDSPAKGLNIFRCLPKYRV